MRQDLLQFVATFRQLEQQQLPTSEDEEKRWRKLKKRLSASQEERIDTRLHTVPRTIAIASLYPRAGASFIASNYAYLQASNKIPTLLSEFPNDISYYYFALDSAKRGHPYLTSLGYQEMEWQFISMLSGNLRVRIETPQAQYHEITQTMIANWFLALSKVAPYVVIDLSSRWREEAVSWIVDWIDEIWMVIDSDIPRFTRTLATEKMPFFWEEHSRKIRIIANKWNKSLDKLSVQKKVAGTLSLWKENDKNMTYNSLPMFTAEQVSKTQLSGQLFLESYPEHGHHFESLTN